MMGSDPACHPIEAPVGEGKHLGVPLLLGDIVDLPSPGFLCGDIPHFRCQVVPDDSSAEPAEHKGGVSRSGGQIEGEGRRRVGFHFLCDPV